MPVHLTVKTTPLCCPCGEGWGHLQDGSVNDQPEVLQGAAGGREDAYQPYEQERAEGEKED